MAKKVIKEKAIEEALWESANKLRGSVEPSEYKHVVLSLIFLKYAHDRFTERRNELVAEGKEAFADNPVFYNAKNVFYLEPESRWDFLIENAKQNDIAIKIDKALAKVEQSNPTLKGALPSNYYAGLSSTVPNSLPCLMKSTRLIRLKIRKTISSGVSMNNSSASLPLPKARVRVNTTRLRLSSTLLPR